MCVKIKRCELRYATKDHKSNLRDRKKVNTKKKILVAYRSSCNPIKSRCALTYHKEFLLASRDVQEFPLNADMYLILFPAWNKRLTESTAVSSVRYVTKKCDFVANLGIKN